MCEDEPVLGAPFYLTDFVEGIVVTDERPTILDDPADRWKFGETRID